MKTGIFRCAKDKRVALNGERLAWAARGNIDCGRVEAISVPAWPEVPACRGSVGMA